MTKDIKIAPSLLSSDFLRLAHDIQMLEEAGADSIHLDVMDGHFVPNLTFGLWILKAIRPLTKLPIDAHLMVTNPEDYIDNFAKAGADVITIHIEATVHAHRLIQQIKSHNIMAGVSLNPSTSLSAIECILPDVDLVLVMTVNPGFGGQTFIENQYKKISDLRKLVDAKKEVWQRKTLIEVDGGVCHDNATY